MAQALNLKVTQEASDTAAGTQTRPNILIVDDRKENLLATEKVLRHLDANIFKAISGNEALSLILRYRFAVVLLDVQMPEMDGFETATLMQEQEHMRGVPIIFVTAISKDEKYATQAAEIGAVDYIFKPINPEILKSKVKVYLDIYVQREQILKLNAELRQSNEKSVHYYNISAQAQKMEAIGQLTGGIAHDFNNLLAVILGNLDFLRERVKENDPLQEFIKPSIEAAEHGSELTQRLLSFGRKQTLLPKIISINELLHYFSALVRHTLGERIETIVSQAPDLWNVNVDPSQLQNALLNLAVNARDAMPSGGKLIFETQNIIFDEAYAASNEDVTPGEYVMIAVSDTGEGMPREVMEKAFEPFFTTKDVGKGSGLGLSMVYGFVKQSKGHVKIYSEPGHGTSIKIYLPRAEGVALNIEKVKAKPVSTVKKPTLILVVEDNEAVLKLTSSMVESLGYTVLQAETGDAAMTILKARADVELLLTDVMLPGAVNGPALAKQAVALYPNLKVLFNSGYAEHAILQSGILEEGVNLIGKPFRKQQLANKIEEVLKQS